ncbi:MAG: Cytochrome c5 [Burkholderiaceae bacterium]|jgi:cytochrome c5|nr:MAG: Cytochrome c5 [Burkholderiaceae bacterium]
MSENNHAEEAGHAEGPIKTPKQLLVTVIFAFLIPIFGAIGIARYISLENMTGPDAVNVQKSADQRIQRVGQVTVLSASEAQAAVAQAAAAASAAATTAAAAPATAAAPAADLGKKRYDETCFACHATGAAGAPKFGDKAEWAPRIKLGVDALVAKAISGIGAMPPRGGSTASDAEMRAAVEYMVNAAK